MKIVETDRGLMVNLVLRLPHGLHARPSARLSKTAREFRSNILLITENGEADARSMVDLLSLAPQANDQITLLATGPDAREALVALYSQLACDQE